MIKNAICIGAALLLIGCATTSLPVDKLSPVPRDRVQWNQPTPSTAGTLVIARDSGLSGGGARVLVSIDGQPAADMRNAEALRLELEPGRKVVVASALAGLGGEIRRPRSLEVTVRAGAVTLVRIGFDDMSSGFSIWQDVAQ